MNLRTPLIKGTSLLAAGQLADNGLVFLRNLTVVNLLSKEQYGISTLFLITTNFLELFSDLSVDKVLIQDHEGHTPEFQGTAQLINGLRGLLMSLILLVSAGWIAALFGVGEIAWAFRILALMPLLRSLHHVGISVMQRTLAYAGYVRAQTWSQFIACAAAAPLCLWLRDFRAVLILLLIQVSVFALVSHLSSETPFRLASHTPSLHRILHFGWPLLLNGMLMFGTMQGDRVMIGLEITSYTKADLALYMVAFSLGMMPYVMGTRIYQARILPLLSRAQEDEDQFAKLNQLGFLALGTWAAAIGIGFAQLGGPVVRLLYGTQYAAAEPLMAWLGAMWAVRLLRAGLQIAAVSHGRTRIPALNNLSRYAGVAAVVVFALLGKPLIWLAVAGLGGELFSLAILFLQIRHGCGLRPTVVLEVLLLPIAAIVAALAIPGGGYGSSTWGWGLLASVLLWLPVALTAIREILRERHHLHLRPTSTDTPTKEANP